MSSNGPIPGIKNLLKNLKIGTKISILVVLTLLLMSLVMGLGLRQINVIGKELRTVVEEDIPLLETLGKITFHNLEQSIHLERAIQSGKRMAQEEIAKENFEIERKNFLRHGQKLAQEIDKNKTLIEQMHNKHKTRESRDMLLKIDYELRSIDKEHTDYQFFAERTFNLLFQGKLAEAETTVQRITKKYEGETSFLPLENFSLAIENFIEYSVANVKKSERVTMVSMFSVSAFILLFSLSLGIVITRSICKPLSLAVNIASQVASGKMPEIQVSSKDETGVLLAALKDMSEALSEANAQLGKKNIQLEKESAERLHGQNILKERIKEISCLYKLSKLVEQPKISLEQIFQETVSLVRSAYQYPDITCVRITFDGKHYKTDNFEKSELSQRTDIKLRGDKAGDIEVYYTGEKAENGKSPFVKEERDLLDAVAEHLGRIAERTRTAEKLQLFRNLIDHSNDCVFVIEPKWGRFLDVNNRASASLGYTREELLNMTVKDIEESIPDDSSWQELIKELKLKADSVIQGRHKRKDATTFFAETTLKLVSQGKEDYIIAVARDITERKQAEEQQAQLLEEVENVNRELKDFAYIISHDLKAPLRGIKTLTDWMATDYADKLDEDGREQMNLLTSRVDRMKNLIDGVLAYSRVGRIKEETAPVNLNDLVPEVIDMLAPPENISITVENELPVVECERTRIGQVFQNLLSNAVKYMDKPQGQIKIGCIEEDGFWKFSIADNGPGIEEKYFEKIFQMFQTLSPRDEFESTGVGLTVVKKIVELYNGRVWVQSKPGEGSTFFFTLPSQKMGVKDAKYETNIVSRG